MPTLARKWTRDLGGNVSYPLIAQGLVFVTAGTFPATTQLYALDQATGATVWGPILVSGGYNTWARATYDAGRLFVVNAVGNMSAFDAATGARVWSVALPNASLGYNATPTALNGRIYTDGGNNEVVAVNESDGSVAWSQMIGSAGWSPPAVTPDGVYVCFSIDDCWKFDPATGARLWHHSTGQTGGGGSAPVVAGGLVWGMTGGYFESAPVLDAATGAQVGTWRGYMPPAVDTANGIGVFYTIWGVIQAQDLATGQALWTFYEDGATGEPAIANGYVYISTSAGTLYVLDEKTGRQVFYDYTFNQQLGGEALAIGHGLLGVPAGTTLMIYTSSGNPPWGPPSFTPIPNQPDQAITLGMDVAHTGGQPADALAPPLVKAWSVNLPALASYALIANGMVFVIAGGPPSTDINGARLYALDLASGRTVFGPIEIGGQGNNASLAYDQGRLFTLNGSGWLKAFDSRNGVKLWSAPMPLGAMNYDSPPAPFGGVVYVNVGDSLHPSALAAFDEATGALLWSEPISVGTGSPAVSNGGVYVSQCTAVADFDAVTGSPRWVDGSFGVATCADGTTPVVSGGAVYARFNGAGTIYNASTGVQTGTFTADLMPAFDGGSLGFFLKRPIGTVSPSLEAHDVTSGKLVWSFTGDGQLSSNPVVANGFVYVGSLTGTLFVLDKTTGSVVWSGPVGAPIYPGYDIGNGEPVKALAIGQGTIVVPNTNNLTAFKSGTPAPVTGVRSGR